MIFCCLQLFQHNKKVFLYKYVTMDETWIHHFIPESNWQSVEWTVAGESCPKWPDARFQSLYFGMHKVFCLSITLRKEEPSRANII